MHRLIYTLLLAVALPAFHGNVHAQNLQADLDLMMAYFAGRFDNNLQVWQEKQDSTDADLIHEHIHSIFAPVRMPAFGDHVFYVQQYMDGDPTKVYRQRLYSFAANETEQAIELTIYSFPDEAAFMDAHLDPTKLDGLTPDQMRTLPGCEVFWKREDDHFNGYTKENACKFLSRRSGKTIITTDDLYLDEDEIWIRDQAVDEDGNYVFGHKGNVHHQLKRVREFTGWAALRKEGTEGEWIGIRGIEMHDQGQRYPLVTAEGDSLGYTVELAQLVYQNTQTAILKLALYEEGNDRALSYTWANPEASRLGINLRWIQVGLTLKEP